MAIKNRYWYVFGLDVTSDPNGAIFAQVAGEQMEAQPAPARRNNRDQGFARIEGEAPRLGNDGGYGFKVSQQVHRTMNQVFTSKASAQLYAKEQAEKNPKTMYGIYECIQVFETTTPTIIEKKWTDNGELIPVV